MKKILSLTMLLVNFSFYAQTQSELNETALTDYKKADLELNIVYKKILAEYKSDAAFITNLKKAQRIWLTFRDAEILIKYPKREQGYYGSIFPVCWNNYLTELTIERINKLKIWLDKAVEGDVCAGSVQIKE